MDGGYIPLMQMTMNTRKRIGEALVETMTISQQQLDQAIAFQKGKNKRIGKILILWRSARV